MEWKDFEASNENPLDNLLSDGGFTAIFRRIACIGDSLSSGEFEALCEDGTHTYHDCFEYSWGQFMARSVGATVYNFSRGGMTATQYIKSFADEIGAWEKEKAAQAYIIALGVNDLLNRGYDLGSFSDIDFKDWTKNNPDTFAGAYATIIERYREIEPHARFFLVTMPKDERDTEEKREKKRKHAELLHALKEAFPYTYVIDLYEHAPVLDKEFHDKFDGHVGHLNPMGYYVFSKMIATYIDYHVRRDYRAFCQVGFIGTEQYDEKFD